MSENKDHIGPLDKPELKQNIFEVPKGYFKQLQKQITDQAKLEDSELENNEQLRQNPLKVPTGYFDQLEGKILDNVKAENGPLATSEHLKEPVFTTPAGYFDKLEEKLTSSIVEEKEEPKVILLYQQSWFKMAVAAVLVMGLFIFKPWVGSGLVEIEDLSNDIMLEYLYDQGDVDLDLIASVDGFDTAIDEILEEETASYDFDLGLNPELDYDFEYFEQ